MSLGDVHMSRDTVFGGGCQLFYHTDTAGKGGGVKQLKESRYLNNPSNLT